MIHHATTASKEAQLQRCIVADQLKAAIDIEIRKLFQEPRNEGAHAQCAIADCLRTIDAAARVFKESR